MGVMADLLGGSSTIRTSGSADIFNAKTDVAHRNKEASEDNGKNNGISAFTSTSSYKSKYKVDNTTPKISILFNQSADIKVGYFSNF